jgi:hypothetical protein
MGKTQARAADIYSVCSEEHRMALVMASYSDRRQNLLVSSFAVIGYCGARRVNPGSPPPRTDMPDEEVTVVQR